MSLSSAYVRSSMGLSSAYVRSHPRPIMTVAMLPNLPWHLKMSVLLRSAIVAGPTARPVLITGRPCMLLSVLYELQGGPASCWAACTNYGAALHAAEQPVLIIGRPCLLLSGLYYNNRAALHAALNQTIGNELDNMPYWPLCYNLCYSGKKCNMSYWVPCYNLCYAGNKCITCPIGCHVITYAMQATSVTCPIGCHVITYAMRATSVTCLNYCMGAICHNLL